MMSWSFPRSSKRASVRAMSLALGAVAFCASAQAPTDLRVALVIGNAAYTGVPALANPVNDAAAMATTLKGLGFSVFEVKDGTREQMAQAIAQMRQTLAGKKGVGMLYYAGHGLQLDWRNYMVPVDAKLVSAAEVPQQTVDVNSVIDAFKTAGNRMNIVVLDACRDNPFADKGSGKGLAQLDAPPGTFLAYATAPGNVAEDGDAKSANGLYTSFLLQELKKPQARIEDVFKRVRFGVRQASGGRQIPWESTSLEDEFHFDPRSVANQRPRPGSREDDAVFALEKLAWDQVRQSTRVEDLYAFLQTFPTGRFAEQAHFRLNQKAAPQVVALSALAPVPTTAGAQPAAAVVMPARPEVRPAVSTPGPQYFGPRFAAGDRYEIVIKDAVSGAVTRRERVTIAGVEGDQVRTAAGESLVERDAMGARVKDDWASYDPPLADMPAEFQLGKQWSGRTRYSRFNDGRKGTYSFTGQITGREQITIDGRVFEVWVAQINGSILTDGASPVPYNSRVWMSPLFGFPLRQLHQIIPGTFVGASAPRRDIHEIVGLSIQR